MGPKADKKGKKGGKNPFRGLTISPRSATPDAQKEFDEEMKRKSLMRGVLKGPQKHGKAAKGDRPRYDKAAHEAAYNTKRLVERERQEDHENKMPTWKDGVNKSRKRSF